MHALLSPPLATRKTQKETCATDMDAYEKNCAQTLCARNRGGRPRRAGVRLRCSGRASGSALRLSSLLPQRRRDIQHKRICSQPVRISLAELIHFVVPDIGRHDEQLGVHPDIVGEASSGRLTQ